MKYIRKTALALITATALAFSPVAIPGIPVVSQSYAAAIKLNTTNATVYTGNTLTLKLSGTSSKIKWASGKKSVATVSDKGVVTGIKAGTTTITAAVGSKKYTCKITVKNPSISQSALTLKKGKTATLSVKGTKGTLTWKSSKTSIATVNSKGLVTAKAAGTATITAKDKNGTYTCKITVTSPVSRLAVSETKITLNQKSFLTVTLKDSTEKDTVYYDIADENILSCSWGEWESGTDSLNLYITPKTEGSTTVKITTEDGSEEAEIKVTVEKDTRTSASAPETSEVAAKCSPSVVQIATNLGLGTGFFTEKGVIATNYHVIENASSITVKLNNGKEYKIDTILGYDKDLDLALLSLPGIGTPLPLSRFAPKTGDTSYAIGNPLGLDNTFSKGTISNSSRVSDNVEYIQTDTAISPGNSGGPLLNIYGEVIGINTMQYTEGQNLNFALNITQLYSVSTSDPVAVESISGSPDDTDYAKVTITEDTAKSGNLSTAQDVPPGYYIKGSIDPSSDPYGLDSYRITLTKATTRISLLGTPTTDYISDLDSMYMEVWDSNGKFLLSGYEDDYGLLDINADLPAGTYYIHVFTLPGKIYLPLPYLIYYSQS